MSGNLTRVECPDCGWGNQSGDHKSVIHSAWVHNEMLRKGHHASEVEVCICDPVFDPRCPTHGGYEVFA